MTTTPSRTVPELVAELEQLRADRDELIQIIENGKQALESLPCVCWTTGPDEFGNRDLIEREDCPIHG